jgi:hypothetical protein
MKLWTMASWRQRDSHHEEETTSSTDSSRVGDRKTAAGIHRPKRRGTEGSEEDDCSSATDTTASLTAIPSALSHDDDTLTTATPIVIRQSIQLRHRPSPEASSLSCVVGTPMRDASPSQSCSSSSSRHSRSSFSGTSRDSIATQFRQEQDDRESLAYRKDLKIFASVLLTLLLVSVGSYHFVPAPHVGTPPPTARTTLSRGTVALGPHWSLALRRQSQRRALRKMGDDDQPVTVIVRGHHLEWLYRARQVYAACPLVDSIHVDWNGNATMPSSLELPSVQQLSSTMTSTRALWLVHEFVDVSCADLTRAYNEWSNEATRAVGFFPAWLPHTESYALLSDRAIMVPSYYLPDAVFRSQANDCQDFVLSAKVTALSQRNAVAMTMAAETAKDRGDRNRNHECYTKILQAMKISQLPTSTAIYTGRPSLD